ncbi:hypothetical protein VTK26DRAFT_4989 [Humicola hyalothermophila]
MALLGLTVIFASVILFCMRRPAWLPSLFGGSQQTPPESAEPPSREAAEETAEGRESPANGRKPGPAIPSLPRVIPQVPEVRPADLGSSPSTDSASDEQTTPKASAVRPPQDQPVPALTLSLPGTQDGSHPTAPAPANGSPATRPPAPQSTLMPPPPRPPTLRGGGSTPSLAPPPSSSSPRGPIPNRGPGCSTLAPPPTHSSKPAKPSRAVVLSPGHSPLDWARLSGHPTADLRGLPPGTPYLRVTPSMLRRQTGRKGKDAWTVLGGRVYNITPYLPFHPGGEPELLRGAGRDGTKLFGEIHPWVNYEGMLAACLVGIYVPEEEPGEGKGGPSGPEAAGRGGGSRDMEAMD